MSSSLKEIRRRLLELIRWCSDTEYVLATRVIRRIETEGRVLEAHMDEIAKLKPGFAGWRHW